MKKAYLYGCGRGLLERTSPCGCVGSQGWGVVKVILMQEIDGLQVRHLQLASCLHFMEHEEGCFRLDTYNG